MNIKKLSMTLLFLTALAGIALPMVAMDSGKKKEDYSWNPLDPQYLSELKKEQDAKQTVAQKKHTEQSNVDTVQSAMSLDEDDVEKKKMEDAKRKHALAQRAAKKEKDDADKAQESALALKSMENYKSKYVGNDDEARKA